MPGSSQSIAEPNVILNTVVADSLSHFANVLEGTPKSELQQAMTNLIAHTYKKHKRIVFNGNNYAVEWEKEAERRGLFNLRTTPDAVPALIAEKNVALFKRYGIYSEAELRSRCEIELNNYAKQIRIEASTMCEIVRREILPAGISYLKELSETAYHEKILDFDNATDTAAAMLARELSGISTDILNITGELESEISKIDSFRVASDAAEYCRDYVIGKMALLREKVDLLESRTAKKYLTYPTYADLLFSV